MKRTEHMFKQNTHCHIIHVNTDALMISLLMKNLWQPNTAVSEICISPINGLELGNVGGKNRKKREKRFCTQTIMILREARTKMNIKG